VWLALKLNEGYEIEISRDNQVVIFATLLHSEYV